MSVGHEIAVFALGSFWKPEDFFAGLPGVLATTVGYTGGSSNKPSFHNLGDHCEAIRIEFDSHIISYEELLGYFWQQHDPTAEYEVQFRSAIFYADETHRRLAQESKNRIQEDFDEPVVTEIEPASQFYEAESYHQHYLAKLRGEI